MGSSALVVCGSAACKPDRGEFSSPPPFINLQEALLACFFYFSDRQLMVLLCVCRDQWGAFFPKDPPDKKILLHLFTLSLWMLCVVLNSLFSLSLFLSLSFCFHSPSCPHATQVVLGLRSEYPIRYYTYSGPYRLLFFPYWRFKPLDCCYWSNNCCVVVSYVKSHSCCLFDTHCSPHCSLVCFRL